MTKIDLELKLTDGDKRSFPSIMFLEEYSGEGKYIGEVYIRKVDEHYLVDEDVYQQRTKVHAHYEGVSGVVHSFPEAERRMRKRARAIAEEMKFQIEGEGLGKNSVQILDQTRYAKINLQKVN